MPKLPKKFVNKPVRRACFTVNGIDDMITDKVTEGFRDLIDKNNYKYIIGQPEKGENGTRHFQGYLSLNGTKRLLKIKKDLAKIFGINPHIEEALGNEKQNRDYCSKKETRDGTLIEVWYCCRCRHNHFEHDITVGSPIMIYQPDIIDLTIEDGDGEDLPCWLDNLM